MPPSEQVLANDHGFRIQQTPDKVFFERPPATISPLLAWIPLGVGFLAFFVGIALFASSFSDPEARADLRTGAVLLWGGAVLAFFAGRRALRRLALDQKKAGAQLLLDDAALRNLRGEVLAERAQLSTRTRIDLTDGMGGFRWARVVYLCWPQGEVVIFRSYEKRAVQGLCQALAGLGIRSAG
jgi:membrane protein implicated in regulation of membrane protease activity